LTNHSVTGTPVEMDETFIGGKPKNIHRSKRLKRQIGEYGYAEKTAVLGMFERGTRQVRATVTPAFARWRSVCTCRVSTRKRKAQNPRRKRP
jgi:hypothetical protein